MPGETIVFGGFSVYGASMKNAESSNLTIFQRLIHLLVAETGRFTSFHLISYVFYRAELVSFSVTL